MSTNSFLRRPQERLHVRHRRETLGLLPLLPREERDEERRANLLRDNSRPKQLDAPLPSPLPARSSRGEGVCRPAFPALWLVVCLLSFSNIGELRAQIHSSTNISFPGTNSAPFRLSF